MAHRRIGRNGPLENWDGRFHAGLAEGTTYGDRSTWRWARERSRKRSFHQLLRRQLRRWAKLAIRHAEEQRILYCRLFGEKVATIAIQPIEGSMSTFKVVAYNDETPPKEVALPSAPTVAGDNPTLADVVYDSAANVITVTRKPGQPSGVETLTATLGSHTAQLAVQVPNNDVASIAIVPTP